MTVRERAMSKSNTHAKEQDTKPVEEAAQPAAADRNVDQIRDILFGGQMRDYERRFTELSERLDQEAQRLRHDTETRVAALEKRLDEQFDRLQKALRQEIQDRGQSLDDLESRVQQAARTQRTELSASIASVGSDLNAADERLRKALAELQAAL